MKINVVTLATVLLCFFVFDDSKTSNAQWVDNGWIPNGYSAPPAYGVPLQAPTANESNLRPYAPYPGQPGFRSSFSSTISQFPIQSPSSFGQSVVGDSGEIIISEEPVDGLIIGRYVNGRLVYEPGYRPTQVPTPSTFRAEAFDSQATELKRTIEVVDANAESTKQSVLLPPGESQDVEPGSIAVEDVDSDREITRLKTEIESLNQQIKELKTRSLANQDQYLKAMKQKESRLYEQSAKIESLSSELLVMQSEVKELTKSQQSSGKAEARKLLNQISRLKDENASLKKRIRAAAELTAKVETEMKEFELGRIADLEKLKSDNNQKTAQHEKVRIKLAHAQQQFEEQKVINEELKKQFIQAFEAAKESQERVKRLEEKIALAARTARSKSSGKPDAGKARSEEDKEKEKRFKKRKEELLKEMESKMAAAQKRISAVGKRKIESRLKNGDKESSQEIKSIKKQIAKSIEVSDRKIRTRYQRKIDKLK